MNDSTQFIEKIERRNEYLGKLGSSNCSLFDGPKQYLHTYNFYFLRFNNIPNRITMHHSKVQRVINRIEKEFSDRIVDRHYMRYGFMKNTGLKYSHVVFVMKNEIILDIELTGEVGILFTETGKDEAAFYEKLFQQRYSRSTESRIHLVSQGHFGADLTPITIKKPVVNLAMNYNDDFMPVHKLILNNIRKKNKSGLVLLHGCPGSGKSTYIRYLINLSKKKVIFLPPSFAATLESPQLTSLLKDNPQSIFIIEDAEQLIKSRELNGESKISFLLNLTDGILGDAFNSIFICTFNTDLRNIDEALLRRGRLIASYKFEELPQQKIVRLKEHFGLKDLEVNGNMVLSDIYHLMENRFDQSKPDRKFIGFKKQEVLAS